MAADMGSPLHTAALAGDLAGVKAALASGIALEAKGNAGATAMVFAAGAVGSEILEFLIAQGGNVNALSDQKTSPLCTAAMYGRRANVALLLKAGASTDSATSMGTTALHFAAGGASGRGQGSDEDYAACVSALLAAAPQLQDAKDRDGQIPLFAFNFLF